MSGLAWRAQWHWRPMNGADVDAVCAMEQAACLHPSHAWTAANYRSSLASAYWLRVMCAPDGHVAAVCVCMFGVDELHLLNIAVGQPWHGQGLARWILTELDALARQQRLPCIWLEVRPSNLRARRLYQSRGYEDISVRKNYYPAGQGREDAVVMRREVAIDAPLA